MHQNTPFTPVQISNKQNANAPVDMVEALKDGDDK